MLGAVRLYLEPNEKLPLHRQPTGFMPVRDCSPEQAPELKRQLQKRGYTVIAVPL